MPSAQETPPSQADEGCSPAPPVPEALKRFIWDIQSMVELTEDEREILFIGRDLMTRLVASDDWIPAVFEEPDPERCQQFQLFADGLERFSVVASVLAAGQELPPTLDPVWELIGVLRGVVDVTRYPMAEDGQLAPAGECATMQHGSVATFTSSNRDALRLRNEPDGGVSIVIHAYGGEMAKIDRRTFPAGGEVLAGPATYANPADAPPYDIFSIQTRIED